MYVFTVPFELDLGCTVSIRGFRTDLAASSSPFFVPLSTPFPLFLPGHICQSLKSLLRICRNKVGILEILTCKTNASTVKYPVLARYGPRKKDQVLSMCVKTIYSDACICHFGHMHNQKTPGGHLHAIFCSKQVEILASKKRREFDTLPYSEHEIRSHP